MSSQLFKSWRVIVLNFKATIWKCDQEWLHKQTEDCRKQGNTIYLTCGLINPFEFFLFIYLTILFFYNTNCITGENKDLHLPWILLSCSLLTLFSLQHQHIVCQMLKWVQGNEDLKKNCISKKKTLNNVCQSYCLEFMDIRKMGSGYWSNNLIDIWLSSPEKHNWPVATIQT